LNGVDNFGGEDVLFPVEGGQFCASVESVSPSVTARFFVPRRDIRTAVEKLVNFVPDVVNCIVLAGKMLGKVSFERYSISSVPDHLGEQEPHRARSPVHGGGIG
jgi:hypothetical protein